jgi:hypothetical protein
MGIGIVLMFWMVAGLFAAGFAALVLGGLTALFTRRVKKGRAAVLFASFALPFVCLGWFFVAFFAQALINEAYFNRDAGLGDSWKTPLPNGYAVEFIDVLDHGTLFDPVIEQRDHGTAGGQEGTIGDVTVAQISGPLIFGCAEDRDFNDKVARSYCFILDTRTHRREDFAGKNELQVAVRRHGSTLQLKPLWDVYLDHRLTWFDSVAAVVMYGPAPLGVVLLGIWIIRLRRRRETI